MNSISKISDLNVNILETNQILKKLTIASRQLAELKGVAATIPNQRILINTLSLQEAKDSSEIENIVTTNDELFQNEVHTIKHNAATKEVLEYRKALLKGYDIIKKSSLLTCNSIIEIQSIIEPNKQGFRKLLGTDLKNTQGEVIYTPPQHPNTIIELMSELEKFINDDSFSSNLDPLIKMAIIHHQFESIHPFYDGNGRTGRIINVLYLVKENLLDIPVLYLSRYIIQNKAEYYKLLQSVRINDDWERWILFILDAIEKTANFTMYIIQQIKIILQDYKERIRSKYSFYSQDLVNCLFIHPYTKIDFMMNELKISRITATKYLDILVKDNFLSRLKIGTSYYYINTPLFNLLNSANSLVNDH